MFWLPKQHYNVLVALIWVNLRTGGVELVSNIRGDMIMTCWTSYIWGLASAAALFVLISLTTEGPVAWAGGHESADPDLDAPVYMITVGRIVPGGDMGPYTLKMLEAAAGRGMESLVFNSNFKVFEGNWEHDGFLSVERAPSMKALEDFWSSDSYQEAIALRDDVIEVDYAVAVEGR